jgi:kindlin 2
VNLSQGKYGIKVEVPSEDGMTEVHLRCDNEEQYARWMAACRLASRGKTLADSSYGAEKKSILAFLSMQHPAPSAPISSNK